MTKPDLDERMREILEDHNPIVFESTDDAMVQLKAAFREAGYIQKYYPTPDSLDVITNITFQGYKHKAGEKIESSVELKTGQSFYDAFEKEMINDPHTLIEWQREPYEMAYEAAKRAAGLNEVEE